MPSRITLIDTEAQTPFAIDAYSYMQGVMEAFLGRAKPLTALEPPV